MHEISVTDIYQLLGLGLILSLSHCLSLFVCLFYILSVLLPFVTRSYQPLSLVQNKVNSIRYPRVDLRNTDIVNLSAITIWHLKGALKMREWKMQEWKIQELKHMESRLYRNFWRSKLESGCVWLPAVDSRQLVASSTELTGLVPGVWVIHFDVEADSDSGAQKPRVFILLLYSVFFADVCATHMIITVAY